MSGARGRRTPRAILRTAAVAHRYLRMGPSTTSELARRVGVSGPTVRRAMKWLRCDCGAPISVNRLGHTCTWELAPGWSMPLLKLTNLGELVPVVPENAR